MIAIAGELYLAMQHLLFYIHFIKSHSINYVDSTTNVCDLSGRKEPKPPPLMGPLHYSFSLALSI